jgi:glycosyltransferase involved in cell wall biosynthesis
MRKILYIDPHFSSRSPSMKTIVRAFPAVVEVFDEVEVWSVECEVQHPKLNWQRMWAPKIWPLRMVWCVVGFHLRALWRFGILRQPRPEIIQCTDFYAMFADIIYVHFHFARYKKIVASKPDVIVLPLGRKLFLKVSGALERMCFVWATPLLWLTVSEAMAQSLTQRENLEPVVVLPNAYNPQRFNPAVRETHRAVMRAELGLTPNDVVIGFSALGNLERKGLPLLLEAVRLLRREKHQIKLLIVGPTMDEIAKIDSLDDAALTQSEIIATGHVTDTERYFSAMDAFVFPSHCESFCLVLMEAAALGVPVFPAPFDGHEMTLIEGGNGALIPWDAEGIAEVIIRSMPMIQEQTSTAHLAKGCSDEEFQRRLLAFYESISPVSCELVSQ